MNERQGRSARCSQNGVVVEAELGTLAGVEDKVNDSSYTRPEDVQEFVERTGCDGKT